MKEQEIRMAILLVLDQKLPLPTTLDKIMEIVNDHSIDEYERGRDAWYADGYVSCQHEANYDL